MSRHFHDLSMMMDTYVCEDALADQELYTAIINHRKYYNRLRGIDYDLLYRPHINFYPPEGMIDSYREDYKVMLENMIYGIAPDENLLFVKIAELINRFRSI